MKPYLNTIKSITYDNEKEFSKHEIINGIIRKFFPKGTDFDMMTNKQIKRVEDWINNRPMKVHRYLTLNEKYKELIKNSKC